MYTCKHGYIGSFDYHVIPILAYDPKSSQVFISCLSFDSMLEGGPLIRPGGGANQEEEEVEDGGDGVNRKRIYTRC